MHWRSSLALMPALALGLLLVAGASHATPIPFRQDPVAGPWQLSVGYGIGVLLLVGLALGLFILRKRLGARLPSLLQGQDGLQSIASLRLPGYAGVHVVRWRERELVFAQSGGKVTLLAEFDAGRTPTGISDFRP